MADKIFGIVCEFNPFHNGHAYLIDTAKALGADKIVLAMSGNFVQRGAPAIFNDRVRAKAAMEYGADLVIKIPVAQCLSSADFYAKTAVSLLYAAGVNHLLFGSECGDLTQLQKSAEIMHSEEYTGLFGDMLGAGLSYARSRQLALQKLGGDATHLSNPNNILAVEYLLSLYGKDIRPFTVPRLLADHHEQTLYSDVASATAIRQLILSQGLCACSHLVPNAAQYQGQTPPDEALLDRMLLAFVMMSSTKAVNNIPFGKTGLGNRLKNNVAGCENVAQLVDKCTSNRITKTRVWRAIWCLAIGVTMDDVLTPPPYLYVLGATQKGLPLLKTANMHVITSLASVKTSRFAKLESTATDLYGAMMEKMPPNGQEFRNKFILL